MTTTTSENKKVTIMDLQKLINVMAAVLLAVGAWWCNTMSTQVQSLQVQITSLNVELAKNYMTRPEIQETLRQINSSLEDIKKALINAQLHGR